MPTPYDHLSRQIERLTEEASNLGIPLVVYAACDDGARVSHSAVPVEHPGANSVHLLLAIMAGKVRIDLVEEPDVIDASYEECGPDLKVPGGGL